MHFVNTPPYFFRKLIHTHHTGRDCGLHLLDHLFNIERGYGRLIGQSPNLGCHNRETASVFSGLLCLDRGVKRKQVRLVGNPRDRRHYLVDIARLFVEHCKFGVDRASSIHYVPHGFFHAR